MTHYECHVLACGSGSEVQTAHQRQQQVIHAMTGLRGPRIGALQSSWFVNRNRANPGYSLPSLNGQEKSC